MYDFENMDKRLIAYVNIFILANRLQAIMDKGLEEITAKQWLALTMIDAFEEAPTLKEMANLAGVTHQNMKQIVNKLEEKGFVEIVQDEKDRRAIRIKKTEKAIKVRDRDTKRNWNFVFDMFSCLDEEEMKVFHKAQEKLCNKLLTME